MPASSSLHLAYIRYLLLLFLHLVHVPTSTADAGAVTQQYQGRIDTDPVPEPQHHAPILQRPGATVPNTAIREAITTTIPGPKAAINMGNTPSAPDAGQPKATTSRPRSSNNTQQPRPSIQDPQPHASPEPLFTTYASQPTNDGWTGADSTFSIPLPDGRILWLFSDTYLGPLNPNGTRPTNARMINNCFMLQTSDNNLTTITGADRTAIMPPPAAGHWYWVGDGLVSEIDGRGEVVQMVFQEFERAGDGGLLQIKFVRNVVATFDLGRDSFSRPVRVDPLPSAAETMWGGAVMTAARSGDGYTYIYGARGDALNKTMRVARVSGTDLSRVGEWRFLRAGGEWTAEESEAIDVVTGVANEFSVTPWNDGQFVLVSQDSFVPFSNRILIWYGSNPFGPFERWEGHDEVYRMPEVGVWGSYGDADVVGYNAHVHPELQEGDRWTMSYNVNSMDGKIGEDGDNYRDPSIYRPRFVSFRIVPS
ncbi:hypothetical protein FQN51_005364 [Onygenales sp. PD_10]|nr:hypothetical protein FQN51_005364 [Onygenales sp. PD_10]